MVASRSPQVLNDGRASCTCSAGKLLQNQFAS
jgi:hypothetical protein